MVFDLCSKRAVLNLFHTFANTKSPECALTVGFIQSAKPLNQNEIPSYPMSSLHGMLINHSLTFSIMQQHLQFANAVLKKILPDNHTPCKSDARDSFIEVMAVSDILYRSVNMIRPLPCLANRF